jgi:hypothetical protein
MSEKIRSFIAFDIDDEQIVNVFPRLSKCLLEQAQI